MLLRPRPLALPLAASILIASCGGGNLASQLVKAPDVGQAMKGQAKCGVEKSQAKPLIVEWPPADRSELESDVKQGLVVVHYEGCDMNVLSRCSVPAKYTYQATTRNHDKVEMKDEDDLYANLPVGAAKLESKLKRSGRLTVDMNLVGRFKAEKTTVLASDLQGGDGCAGATHFVYGLTVGAFDFYAGGKADVSGSAGIGNIGAGGASQAEREDLSSAGDIGACSKASPDDKSPPAQCGALIRIEVVPIQGAAGAPVQNASNGQPQASPPQQQAYAPQQPASPSVRQEQPAPTTLARPSGGSSQARMVSLPGGTFRMGQRGDTVTVRPFSLDVTEVTADAYAACVRAGACTAEGLQCDARATYGVSGKGNHPINCVDWNQATAYCQWAGERLPTEEEWEWAARGGSQGWTYPWGNDEPGSQLCWTQQGTCAVGTYPRGDAPGGIHDLAGNVGEWTASNGDANTRVNRGGSWGTGDASRLRAAYRPGDTPSDRGTDLGFRCARTP